LIISTVLQRFIPILERDFPFVPLFSSFRRSVVVYSDILIPLHSREGIGHTMEHWHTNNTTAYQRDAGDLTLASRVLTSSSGNIQSYTPDSKDGIENQDPLRLSRAPEPWPKQEMPYPIPEVKLGSNDAHAENLAHLQHRRLGYREKFKRRRNDPAKPYLQHQKYLQYRARQRCDTGPDGKPVWDDRIEDAFQNGNTQCQLAVHVLINSSR
jgi:hypothetical protein